jgi:hypothetical protein
VAPRLIILVTLGFKQKFKSNITFNYSIKIGTSFIMVSKTF